MGTFPRRHGIAILRQHLMEEPVMLHRARALIAERRGLEVSEMTDHEVIDQLEKHGSTLIGPGLTGCNCFLGEEWSQILMVGAINAGIAKLQADTSLKIAKEVCAERGWSNDELHNGRADAFRHCYWSCLMTKALGVFDAFRVGEMHECCNPNPSDERTMDLHNNRVGRSVGAGIQKLFTGDCKEDCLKSLTDGYLITSLGGSAKIMSGGY